MEDWRLIRNYVDNGSQTAFARIVERHLNLVYWTCRRDLHDPQLSEDATQVVFILLAQKARTFRASVRLAGWLFNTARFVAKRASHREAVRQAREVPMDILPETSGRDQADWQRLEPWLNDAIGTLSPVDREAVLMRYIDGFSLADVAAEIGSSDDAAQKRISRALDKLRAFFARKDVTVSSIGLGALMTEHAAFPPPASAHAAVANAISHIAETGSWKPAASPAAAALHRASDAAMRVLQRKRTAGAFGLVLAGALAVHVALHVRGSDTTANPINLAGGERTSSPVSGFLMSTRTSNRTVDPQIEAMPLDPRWSKHVGQTTVSIVAVTDRNRWWRPDGAPLNLQPGVLIKSSLEHIRENAPQIPVVFLLREQGPVGSSPDFSYLNQGTGATGAFICDAPGILWSGSTPTARANAGKYAVDFVIAGDAWATSAVVGLNETTIRTAPPPAGSYTGPVANGAGTWTATVITKKSTLAGSPPDRTDLTITGPLVSVAADMRVDALDRHGRALPPSTWEGPSTGTDQHGNIVNLSTGTSARSREFTFLTPLNDIRAFRIETRPYYSVVFQDIAAQPND